MKYKNRPNICICEYKTQSVQMSPDRFLNVDLREPVTTQGNEKGLSQSCCRCDRDALAEEYLETIKKSLLLSRMDHLPYTCSTSCTDEGTYDEDPELLESQTSFEEGGTNRAGGVDAGTSEVDTYEVDEDE